MPIITHCQTIPLSGNLYSDRNRPFRSFEFFGPWKLDEEEQVASLMKKKMCEFVPAKFNHWCLHYTPEDNLYIAHQTAHDDLCVTGRGFKNFIKELERCLHGNHPERIWKGEKK